jgi:hypothetical protein
MRHRSTQLPPTRDEIQRIVFEEGPSRDDKSRLSEFLNRMRRACFLNARNERVPPRERLVAQYAKDGLVLFLGAGVSKESGVPNWSELAEAVLLKSGVKPDELHTITKALPSYITQFELAGQILGNTGLVKEIYRALYRNMKCKPQLEGIPIKYREQKGWHGWDKILKTLKGNKTLKAVGDLLISGKGTNVRRNPQIHAVLTSNADNLLEIYCLARTRGKLLLTWVDRASVGEHPNETPVYHLHGFLDARRDNLFKSEESSGELLPDLVFRESEYYETIANPASFVNHTPQSFLRRLNALFIGTALDDLNMRRWLHDSFRERVLHRTKYLREFYSNKYRDAEYEAVVTSCRHFWVRPESEEDRDKPGRRWRVPQEPVERVLSNLGVQVVWCKGYEDLQNCIHEVHKRGSVPRFGRQPAPYRS